MTQVMQTESDIVLDEAEAELGDISGPGPSGQLDYLNVFLLSCPELGVSLGAQLKTGASQV